MDNRIHFVCITFTLLWPDCWVHSSCILLDVNRTMTGTIVSHSTYDGTSLYPPSTDRCWMLRSKLGNDYRIELEMERFSLEETNRCNFDSVSIYCDRRDTSTLIGKYCGYENSNSRVPVRYMYSSGDTLFIEFITDGTNQHEGFKFKYRAVRASEHEPSCHVPGMSVGTVLGIAFMAVVIVTVICAVVICCLKHKTRAKVTNHNTCSTVGMGRPVLMTSACRQGISMEPRQRHGNARAVPNRQAGTGTYAYPMSPPPAFSSLDFSATSFPLLPGGVPVAPPPYEPKAESANQLQAGAGAGLSQPISDPMEPMSVRSIDESEKETSLTTVENTQPQSTPFRVGSQPTRDREIDLLPPQGRLNRCGSVAINNPSAIVSVQASSTQPTSVGQSAYELDSYPLSPPPGYSEACAPR